jgi:hypothetical protein
LAKFYFALTRCHCVEIGNGIASASAFPSATWERGKWFTHLVVAGGIIEALDSLALAFPEVTAEQRERLDDARKILEK